ncbi:MAG: cyclase family protein [Pseudomonadota bacterium]|nr:cyclase family protein [Pseudomonadota bacterium]
MTEITIHLRVWKRCTMTSIAAVLGLVSALGLALMPGEADAQIAKNVAAKSPYGASDEIGTLNMMTDASRFDVLKQVAGGKVYDLGVDLFVGMPTCCAPFGDPTFQIWMTHTPAQDSAKELLSYSGDGVSMYTHTGTHIDTLNHFGLHGKIWNQVSAKDALGVRGWTKSGADKYPPIVARGVLIDVAKSKNVAHLATSYSITAADLQEALKKQGTTLRPGDVVLTRTGLMTLWPDEAKYRLADQAGLSLEAAQWLVEAQQAMLVGADNFGVESFPSKDPDNFVPVHTYLQAERGVSLLEAMWLEDLARDQVYEFLFIASPLKMRGATASPIRPLAISIQRK